MREYTDTIECRVTHNYKKKGATCDLKVVMLVAVRATRGRVFQIEMVLGTNANNWCGHEVDIGGMIVKKSAWLRYKNIGCEIKISINNIVECT